MPVSSSFLPSTDVLIIGGGPAGLTGAIYLARFRRSVLLVDDGCSRAAKIPRTRNLPGYPDGVIGAEFMAAMRQQAEHYGVRFRPGRISSLDTTDGGFVARLAEGGQALEVRAALLATGTTDSEPPMPYLAEAVRSGTLRYCPICDGYEVIGQAVGVITNRAAGAGEALYLRNFTDRLTLFVVSPDITFPPERLKQLEDAGIRVEPTPVSSIRLWEGRVTVRHGDAETTCDSLYSALGMQVHSELAAGAANDEEGYLLTDSHHQTSIPGLYAAGDVVQGINQIAVAAGGAAIAAAAMHRALGPTWVPRQR